MKRIIFTRHATYSMKKRGVSEEEVISALNSGAWSPAKFERIECSYELDYNNIWNGRFYKKKQVVPVFVEEGEEITIITVYAFYY